MPYGRRRFIPGLNDGFDVMNGFSLDDDFGPSPYDRIAAVAGAEYAQQLGHLLNGGSGNVSQGYGGYYGSNPEAPSDQLNPFVNNGAEAPRGPAAFTNVPQGADPEAISRARFAESGLRETPTPTRANLVASQARQREADLTWKKIQEWKRTANPSAQQLAEVMNAYQARFADDPNPLDIVKTQDESDPLVGLTRDREHARQQPGYETSWDQMVNPETGRLDWKLINDWRKTSLELAKEAKGATGGPSADDRRQAYEDEIAGLEALKPTPPGKDATPEERDAYRAQQLEYVGHQRRARERFYGPSSQYQYDPSAPADAGPAPTPAPAQGAQQPPTFERAQQVAETLNLPFVGSQADFQRLIESKELQPGEFFVDDSGNTYEIGPDGQPVRK